MNDWQERCVAWISLPNTPTSTTPFDRVSKATEELGEVSRAVHGDHEHRAGRGDAVAEAAQTILVLLTMVGLYYPDRNLMEEVEKELVRAEQKAAAGLRFDE